MGLFKLRVSEYLLSNEGADANGYSEWSMPRGFVVLAPSEKEARSLAAANGGVFDGDDAPWWRDAKLTSCEEIEIDGAPRVVLKDQPTG